jgi:hypothetical protein
VIHASGQTRSTMNRLKIEYEFGELVKWSYLHQFSQTNHDSADGISAKISLICSGRVLKQGHFGIVSDVQELTGSLVYGNPGLKGIVLPLGSVGHDLNAGVHGKRSAVSRAHSQCTGL